MSYKSNIAPIAFAYYRLGESSGSIATDEKGNHSGSYLNDPTLGVTGAIFGDPDHAVTFDGSDQSVSIPHHQDLSFSETDDFSIECWMKRARSGLFEVILDKGDSVSVETMSQGIFTSGNLFQYYISYNSGTWVSADGIVINDTDWHHIVCTHEAIAGGGELSVYIDGTFRDSTTYAGTLDNDDGNPFLIAERTGGSGYFSGSMDEFAIYSRLLTTQEISDHYTWGTTGAPGAVTISGIVELDGSPVVATLRAYESVTGELVEEVESAVGDGSYIFGDGAVNLNALSQYFVLCHYGTDVRPMAHGPVTPILVEA